MSTRAFGAVLLASALFAVSFSSRAWAWADHWAITQAALRPVSELSRATVSYVDFTTLAYGLGYANLQSLNQKIKIAPNYVFAPRLGEKPGAEIAVLAVLSKYSDEPDWGMDQELFDAYPELWNPAYSMMGGRDGLSSQAFRHMYWQALDFSHLLETFKLPLSEEFQPMGKAPERAQVFVELSRRAHDKGYDYWSVRFLADALHYLEDCSQPYHTVQVPTKKFILLPFSSHWGHGLSHYVEQMTNVVSYYHLAFEDYVSKVLMGGENRDGNEVGARLSEALQVSVSAFPELSYTDRDLANEVRAMAHLGVEESSAAGRASIQFFPPIEEDFITMDPRFNDIRHSMPFATDHLIGFEDAKWWARTNPQALPLYEDVVRRMFEPLGYAIRRVVRSELAPLARQP